MTRTQVNQLKAGWLRRTLPMLLTASVIGCHAPPTSPPPTFPLLGQYTDQSTGPAKGIFVADNERSPKQFDPQGRKPDSTRSELREVQPASAESRTKPAPEKHAMFESAESTDSWADPASFENAELPADSSRSAFPVDLPTVLRLTGSQNWAIQLAAAQHEQAESAVTAAEALWLPNLNLGIGSPGMTARSRRPTAK